MFDIDSLETYLDRRRAQGDGGGEGSGDGPPNVGGVAGVAGDYPSAAQAARGTGDRAAPPKSREERLRDFYASRPQAQPLPERRAEEAVRRAEAPGELARPPARELATGPAAGTLQRSGQASAEDEAEALRLKKRGNDLYEARDYEAAVEEYTAAIKTASNSTLLSNRAAAYMMLGWWDQALRDTRAALRRDPDNQRALERHGRVLLAQDQLDDALRVAADLEARVPEEQRQDAAGLPSSIRRLRRLAGAAREPRTLEGCRSVLADFGSQAELVSPLGFRLRRALAKALLERSDALDNQRKIRPALARNRRTEGDVDEIQEITPLAEEALAVTAQLLADNCPDEADVRLLRSRALVRLGRNDDAEREMQRSLLQDPGNEEIRELREIVSALDDLKQRGNAAYKEGNLGQAIHLYTLALERDRAHADTRTCATLYYNRSAARRRQGEFEQALDDVNLSLALHPKWCKALYRRAMLLLECGRYAEALTEFKVVQRADPTFDDDLDDWLRRAHNWLSKAKGAVNYYRFMRLPMDSSKEEIRKQYHRLCLLWHPDKSGGTEESRERFEELQAAYKFLTDGERRARYDFGIWQDKVVRHHTKKREKVKDTWDDSAANEDAQLPHWYDDSLLDEKVESIYWGGEGPPAWLQEKRREHRRKVFGDAA